MKRFSTLLVSICAFLIVFAHDVEIDGIYYNLYGNRAAVTSNSSASTRSHSYYGDIVIPEYITNEGNTYRVSRIEPFAFSSDSNIHSIHLPNTIDTLMYAAFRSTTVDSLTIPSSVKYIGNNCFIEHTKRISENSFRSCSWRKLIFNCDSVVFDEYLFDNSGIGNWGIDTCEIIWNVKSATVLGSDLFPYGGNIYKFTIGDKVESIPEYLTCSLGGTDLKITNLYVGKNVKKIGYEAFYAGRYADTIVWNVEALGEDHQDGYQLTLGENTKLFFGEDVKEIPVKFLLNSNTNLLHIEIPNNVVVIGNSAFKGCSNLTSVNLGKNISIIGRTAFQDCSGLTSIVIPESVTSIEASAFYGCSSLNSTYYTGTITQWCNIDFGDTSANPISCSKKLNINHQFVTELIIPDGVANIKNYAFANCSSLISVTIPESVTNVGEETFKGCTSIASVSWNAKNCADFTSAPFYTTPSQVSSFIFGHSVQHIPAYLCDGMNQLTDIIIPRSVESIGQGAFLGCSSLTSTHYTGTITQWCNINFDGYSTNPGGKLYINDELVTELIIPNDVTAIMNNTFYNCSSLSSITIPNSVKSIGDYAFYRCDALTSVTIPNSITSIGHGAFSDCSSLESLTIGNSVNSIDYYAFNECDNLIQITCLPETPPTVGENVFSNYNAYLYVPCDSKQKYDLHATWGSFKYIECIEETALEDVKMPDESDIKILCGGQLLILRDDKTYTVMGQEL